MFTPGPAVVAGRLPRRAPGPADLRGRLVLGDRAAPRAPGRRAAARAERLALRGGEIAAAAASRARARRRDRAGAGLRQSGRRAGRARLRWRVVRRQPWRRAGVRAAVVDGNDAPHAMGAPRRRPAVRGPGRVERGAAAPGGVPGDDARACATTCARTAFPAWSSACRAASIRRSRPRWPWTRLARRASPGCGCPRASRRRRASTTRRQSARLLGIALETLPIEDGRRRRRGRARAGLRRAAARHRGREPAGAHSRAAADGPLQQVRPDGAHHRQQVGDVGRLCHALRRHVRRLLGAEGHLQDRGVRARPLAQRPAPRRRARPARDA